MQQVFEDNLADTGIAEFDSTNETTRKTEFTVGEEGDYDESCIDQSPECKNGSRVERVMSDHKNKQSEQSIKLIPGGVSNFQSYVFSPQEA
jgi:hypothetical protein